MNKSEDAGITSKNPLLRKIAQLESAEKEKNKESKSLSVVLDL